MKTQLILLSLLELGIAILLGVVVLYLAYSLISQVIFKKYNIQKNNIAYAVLVSAILFAVGLIMEGVIDPIANVIRQLSDTFDKPTDIFLHAIKYIFMFIVISMLLALLINVLAVKLFMTLTKVDEFEEIANNNIAPALITGTITIVIALFAKAPAVQLLEAIIPYPDLPSIL